MLNKIMLFIALPLVGCMAHAHPHADQPQPPVSRIEVPQDALVQAWVWVPTHRGRRNIVIRAHWELNPVPRYMLSRHPHTHVRYVRGRGRPAPPPRRYRR